MKTETTNTPKETKPSDRPLFHLPCPISTCEDICDGDVLRLKLELEGSEKDSLPDEEWNILRKYGIVKESISREILVYRNISLHDLHFIIQILFGWQHSHLLPLNVVLD